MNPFASEKCNAESFQSERLAVLGNFFQFAEKLQETHWSQASTHLALRCLKRLMSDEPIEEVLTSGAAAMACQDGGSGTQVVAKTSDIALMEAVRSGMITMVVLDIRLRVTSTRCRCHVPRRSHYVC
jgi:hypothetical protein